MKAQSRGLNVLTYANGFTQWLYQTDNSPEDVIKEGYFDSCSDIIRNGDAFYIQFSKETTHIKNQVTVSHGYVHKNENGKFQLYKFD